MFEELGLGEAAAFEVPAAFENAFEEHFFEFAFGVDVEAESGFKGFKGGLELGL